MTGGVEGGAPGIEWVEATDAAEHPTAHRPAPAPHPEGPRENGSRCAEPGEPSEAEPRGRSKGTRGQLPRVLGDGGGAARGHVGARGREACTGLDVAPSPPPPGATRVLSRAGRARAVGSAGAPFSPSGSRETASAPNPAWSRIPRATAAPSAAPQPAPPGAGDALPKRARSGPRQHLSGGPLRQGRSPLQKGPGSGKRQRPLQGRPPAPPPNAALVGRRPARGTRHRS